MSKVFDLTGERFTRLLVIEPTRLKNGRFAWKCKCDCGNYIVTPGAQLKNGHAKSCGCYKNDIFKERLQKHGLSRTKLFHVYSGMHSRCENSNHISYANYGERGIFVCDEWCGENGFLNFYNWSVNNGYKQGLVIDRINNDGNYEPLNCRWVTCRENLMNKRNTLFYEYKGQRKTLKDWSIESGIPYKRLRSRIKECGWDFERAITTPVRIINIRKEVI